MGYRTPVASPDRLGATGRQQKNAPTTKIRSQGVKKGTKTRQGPRNSSAIVARLNRASRSTGNRAAVPTELRLNRKRQRVERCPHDKPAIRLEWIRGKHIPILVKTHEITDKVGVRRKNLTHVWRGGFKTTQIPQQNIHQEECCQCLRESGRPKRM